MLFIGDDWAEDHHDVELEDERGHLLARTRLPEGLDGIVRLHSLVAEHAPAEWADLGPEQVAGEVVVGIETDRGPWATALRAAGYLPSDTDHVGAELLGVGIGRGAHPSSSTSRHHRSDVTYPCSSPNNPSASWSASSRSNRQ